MSHLEVSLGDGDSLLHCLDRHHCLEGNSLATIACLSRSPCQLSLHKDTSPVASCLLSSTLSSPIALLTTLLDQDYINDLPEKVLQTGQLRSVMDCLTQKQEKKEMHVTWQLEDTTFTFGWTSPLTVQELCYAPQEIENDFFPRYDNEWSQTEWGSSLIRIEAGNYSVDLDLSKITIFEGEK